MASTLIAPTPITIPFAASGSKNTIPTTSQIGVVDGAASYPDGYPPLCGTPLESGGKPPSRADMNGILYEITANLRYLLGGCVPKFSATFAAAIGGYPAGAIVQDDSGANSYRNLTDGNSTNFNTTPAAIGVSWELVYGPGKTIPNASTSARGIIEIATTAETQSGSDSEKAITSAGLAASVLGGGAATKQNVTASRALGATYTNSSGAPILAKVKVSAAQGYNITANGIVGGVVESTFQGYSSSGNLSFTVDVEVPNGATYSVSLTGTGSLSSWIEWRI